MSCININHPAVLALAEELGKSNFIIGGMIDVWQTKHNQDKIPTAEELDNDVVLDSVSIEDIQRFIENNNDINSNKALQDMEEFMRGDNPITKEDFDLILKNTPNINPELNRDGVNIDDVTFTNEEGEICLESGGVFNNVIDKPSNSWRILTEFKGRTHSEGGIDISLDENGITFSDESTALKAKNGMVIDYFDLISVIK